MNFFKQLYSDQAGVSFGRVATTVCLVNAIGWVWLIVWRTGALPPLEGVTFFTLSFYAGGKLIGKAAQVFTAFAPKKDDAPGGEGPKPQ
jgi:hypothetical protein